MVDTLEFSDNVTAMNAATMNKLLDRSLTNILKNGSFDSWIGSVPDCWGFSANGGTISEEAVIKKSGKNCVKIEKHTADSNYSQLGQRVYPRFTDDGIKSKYMTLCAWVFSSKADRLRLNVYDGTMYYSDYLDVASTWTLLKFTALIKSNPTDLIIGVTVDQDGVDDYDAYIDSMFFSFGYTAPEFTRNPIDDALQCYYYNNDGSYVDGRGAIRCEVFSKTGTLTGGASSEKVDIDLYHGCEKILYVSAGAISFGTTDPADVAINCDEYGGGGGGETSFDVNLNKLSGNFVASEAYEIRGIAIVAGWDNYLEGHGE